MADISAQKEGSKMTDQTPDDIGTEELTEALKYWANEEKYQPRAKMLTDAAARIAQLEDEKEKFAEVVRVNNDYCTRFKKEIEALEADKKALEETIEQFKEGSDSDNPWHYFFRTEVEKNKTLTTQRDALTQKIEKAKKNLEKLRYQICNLFNEGSDKNDLKRLAEESIKDLEK